MEKFNSVEEMLWTELIELEITVSESRKKDKGSVEIGENSKSRSSCDPKQKLSEGKR